MSLAVKEKKKPTTKKRNTHVRYNYRHLRRDIILMLLLLLLFIIQCIRWLFIKHLKTINHIVIGRLSYMFQIQLNIFYFQLWFKTENTRMKTRDKILIQKFYVIVFNGIFLVKILFSCLAVSNWLLKYILNCKSHFFFLPLRLWVLCFWYLACGFYLTEAISSVCYVSTNRIFLLFQMITT